MKSRFILFAFLICALIEIKAQVFSDNFNSVWNPATQGWAIVNNSIPIGTSSVYQGNGATMPAYNGGINDYIALDWMNGSTTGTAGISTWLMTPSLVISNGVILEFATSTLPSSPFADRLQVRLSTANSTVIPSGTTSVGSYTNLLLDINPNLTLNTSSVVSNGTVNGYPQSWAVYTVVVSGITGTVAGRFAFRYFVDDGGSAGANSNYIGIDAVKIKAPCSSTMSSYTVCANGSVTLSTSGGISPNSYTWSPGGSNSSSIVVAPNTTTTYSLNYKDGNVSCPTITGTVTIGSQLSMGINTTSTLQCAGSSITLTAVGPASSYSWNTGSTAASIIVSPSVASSYTLTGFSGTSPNVCSGSSSISINILPSPSIGVTFSPNIICPNDTIDVIFSGANTYTSYLNTFPSLVGNPIFLFTDNSDSNTTFTLMIQGTDANGCSGSTTVIQYVQPLPTITIVSPTVACTGSAITFTATGASTYTWSGPGSVSGSANPATFNAPASAGLMNITAKGTTSLGCKGTGSKAITISDCVGTQHLMSERNEVGVFPNPFSTEIVITGYLGKVEVYNSIGQLVISQKVESYQSINTSELAKGAYIISLLTNEGLTEKTIKLIKN